MTAAPFMGSKKNKIKKVFAPSTPPPSNAVDDDLVADLLTELDSRNKTVQQESATVLEEIQTQQVVQASAADKAGSSKNRFKARQVRPVHPARSSIVTSLSSRQGKLQRSPDTRRLSTPMLMQSWSGRPRKRSAISTRYATS